MSEAVAQFMAVTGAPPEAAVFFLDSAEGDVGAAVDAYYAAGGEFPAAAPAAAPVAQPATALPQQRQRPAAAAAPPAARQPRQAATAAAGRIRSLADLGGSDDGSEEDDSNEYYAGGEKSGQVVRGGDGRRRQVESLFERARQAGATLGSAADLEPGQLGRAGAFRGRARTLGGGSQESQEAGAPAPEPEEDPEQPLVHTITFWANGVFTVDDGEPRDVTDPSNRPFLEAIGCGECPAELAPPHPGQPVNVNMVRSGQDYRPPERPRHAAFSGRGRTLAGDTGAAGGAAGGAKPAAPAAVPAPAAATAGIGAREWEGVDPQLPTTSLQLRLADGSRMVAQFNHSHTVADVRRFIAASRPDMPPGYSLVTAFPQAQLSDDSQTLAQAGLLNAVVIQKQ